MLPNALSQRRREESQRLAAMLSQDDISTTGGHAVNELVEVTGVTGSEGFHFSSPRLGGDLELPPCPHAFAARQAVEAS